jgi:RNA polymerase sigma-70 factor (ECF subfamily)
MVDPQESPEANLDRAELRQAIEHCLQELPEDFRLAVLMVDIQGLDYIEAAQAIGKPLGTVKSRLARARLRLRDCLQGFWELLPAAMRLEQRD